MDKIPENVGSLAAAHIRRGFTKYYFFTKPGIPIPEHFDIVKSHEISPTPRSVIAVTRAARAAGTPEPGFPCCAQGAFLLACLPDLRCRRDRELVETVGNNFAKFLCETGRGVESTVGYWRVIAQWNNAPERTADEVATALEEFDTWRADGGLV